MVDRQRPLSLHLTTKIGALLAAAFAASAPDRPVDRRGTLASSHRRARIKRALLRRDGPTCWICTDPIDLTLPGSDRRSWSVDHVIRVRDGGSNLLGNLRPSHRICNEDRA